MLLIGIVLANWALENNKITDENTIAFIRIKFFNSNNTQ